MAPRFYVDAALRAGGVLTLPEDALVPLGLWLAFAHPLLFFALLAAMLVAVVLLARLLWRGFQRLVATSST